MKQRTIRFAAVGGGVAAIVVVAGIVWFLGRSGPAGPDLEAASGNLPADGPAAPADVEGIWTVNPEVGEGSFVGYRVEETLSGVGSNTAVARSSAVEGTVEIDDGSLVDATVTADLRELRSDDSRRDGMIASALDVTALPSATFTLTEPVELPVEAADGEPFDVTAVGELTIREVTRQAEATLQGLVRDGAAVVVGALPVTFADYGVDVPNVPIVLSAEDHGLVELQLFLVRQ